MKRYLLPFLLILTVKAASYNDLILKNIEQMPKGGGYSVKETAFMAFDKAIDTQGKALALSPQVARPSFCSSATYLLFLKVLHDLQQIGKIKLSEKELTALNFKDEKDGEGVWGRWNANGPGVAKLFKDLNCGENFQDISRATAGDFMKIFWSEEIGKKEFGHLVVYLKHDHESVTFWSSNKPNGYGVKTIPGSQVKWAIFSRLTKPKNIKGVDSLPQFDPFLVDMLKRAFSRKEVIKECQVK